MSCVDCMLCVLCTDLVTDSPVPLCRNRKTVKMMSLLKKIKLLLERRESLLLRTQRWRRRMQAWSNSSRGVAHCRPSWRQYREGTNLWWSVGAAANEQTVLVYGNGSIV